MAEKKELSLEIRHLNKRFNVDGKEVEILNDINLEIKKGEFITIVGHSGCGKSTLLKIIAGLVGYNDGEVIRNGRPVKGPDTDCGMVFQEHRLLPWLKIKDNIGFGLKKSDKQKWNESVQKQIELVKLNGFENAYPSQLSGGMSQRAAIARGLVSNPDILLLDEPLGALDALTRVQMQKEILRIWKEEGTTMIMVTHDIDEAIYLANRVIVMSARPGEIKEIIKIDSTNAKVRGSSEFTYYKNKVYKHFFEDERTEVEYNI
jgi:ABC-type nitrate/sulfonate/bicarbonate transport system ATPase subunit